MALPAMALTLPATDKALPAISVALPAITDDRHPPYLSWFPGRSFEPVGFLFTPLHTRVWRDGSLEKLVQEALALHCSI